MLIERQVHMIQYILKHPEGITGQKLAGELKVSGKTIRNDMVQANACLAEYGCRISASKKTGYYILPDHIAGVKHCISQLDANRSEKPAGSPTERKYYILGKLMGRTRISIGELSERLFVSEQTIYKDLVSLQRYLSQNYNFNGIRLESGGAELCEPETCIRELVFRMIQTQVSSTNKLMDLNFYQFVKDIDHVEEIHSFVRYISRYCDQKEILISDQILYISAWILFYTNVRIGEGHILERKETFQKDDMLSSFLRQVSGEWFLDFEDGDLCQLYDCLKALGFLSLDSGLIGNDTAFVCEELMARVREMYGVDFSSMPSLADDMKRHLEFAIRRIKLDYQLTNPLKDEVKKKYSFSYQIALQFAQLLYEVYEKHPTEDEVSFFAVYIQTCLHMQSATVGIQLVHGTTLGYIHLLEHWLKREFAARIYICGYCSQYKLADMCRENQAQMVISTVELDTNLPVPVLLISNLPTAEDKNRIDQCITQIVTKGCGNPLLLSLLNTNRIFFFDQGESFEEMVETCALGLEASGFIRDAQRFAREILEREAVYPTLMDHGCYLPHPLQNQAEKNGIALGITRNRTGKEPEIRMLFVLALEAKIDKRFQSIYNFIQSIASSSLTIQDLQQMETGEDVNQYLQNMYTII